MGLRASRHGIVVLSPTFFAKRWPQEELKALYNLATGDRRLLPVLHELTFEDLRRRWPLLADIKGTTTDIGILEVAAQIRDAVGLQR